MHGFVFSGTQHMWMLTYKLKEAHLWQYEIILLFQHWIQCCLKCRYFKFVGLYDIAFFFFFFCVFCLLMEPNLLHSLWAKEKILEILTQDVSKMLLAFLPSSVSCCRLMLASMPCPWLQCSSVLYSATEMTYLAASCSKIHSGSQLPCTVGRFVSLALG